MLKNNILLSILILLIGCKTSKLPSKRYSQVSIKISDEHENENLKIDLKNPLNCPIRIWINNANKELQTKFDKINPIILESKSDTSFVFFEVENFNKENFYSASLGNPLKEIKNIKVELPFQKNKEYNIIQGNDTNYTHNTNYARYAIDFNLKTNDTICSATSGFVVGIVDKYEFGGEGDKWKPFGNFITIYEPNSGIFTQYVHLVKNGSLVKVGDSIISGQKIALSGETGQTNIEHLHFNCLIPVNDNGNGMKSIPIEFIEGYKSVDLKKGDVTQK